MAAFGIDSFTKVEMESQHNYMVEKNELERITEWAFYFVNGIALKRNNPKNKVAAANKRKRTVSTKKAIRTEMVPDWLHKEDVPSKPKEEVHAQIISDERKKAIWEQVDKLSAGN